MCTFPYAYLSICLKVYKSVCIYAYLSSIAKLNFNYKFSILQPPTQPVCHKKIKISISTPISFNRPFQISVQNSLLYLFKAKPGEKDKKKLGLSCAKHRSALASF